MSSVHTVEDRPRNVLRFLLREMKPRRPYVTLFNVIFVPVILVSGIRPGVPAP